MRQYFDGVVHRIRSSILIYISLCYVAGGAAARYVLLEKETLHLLATLLLITFIPDITLYKISPLYIFSVTVN